MLILSRRPLESIMIGDEIQITVTEIVAGKVKIGILAPKHIQVHRMEVYHDIKKGRNESALPAVPKPDLNDVPR